MRPKAMLFGEPASALDPELVGEALRLTRSLAEEGGALLVGAHEMGLAREASDRAIFVPQRRVEAESPPAELSGDPTSERFRQFIAGAPPGGALSRDGAPRAHQCCQWPGCHIQPRPWNT